MLPAARSGADLPEKCLGAHLNDDGRPLTRGPLICQTNSPARVGTGSGDLDMP